MLIVESSSNKLEPAVANMRNIHRFHVVKFR